VLLLTAAAIALLAVGVVAGMLTRADPADRVAEVAGSHRFKFVDLVAADGASRGSVSLAAPPPAGDGTDDADAPLVLTMTLTNLPTGEYHCVLDLDDHSRRDVAAWAVDGTGYGTWAIPLDAALHDVRSVSVVDARGEVVAVAALR